MESGEYGFAVGPTTVIAMEEVPEDKVAEVCKAIDDDLDPSG